ncbi:uncharacterized protein MONBRDRAFT_22941 [Monosiga brevicollis MX1]|uniref:Sialidase domain-containing protein n=1 Tax=Monosiga brevicollis TaxID=81824 RepID=A9USI8_MONBE|nr:uncharacterized protein MONBRDRAFT_22941 [Monosiga brevicollis MX1]EDQ91788.1 predicted protein [Monosiga brevicollis MX1]|eukprot:XP_001743074.1 hypothetical protein [Monosiga brevicollis MX1]
MAASLLNVVLGATLLATAVKADDVDWRRLDAGRIMYSEIATNGYMDQPRCVIQMRRSHLTCARGHGLLAAPKYCSVLTPEQVGRSSNGSSRWLCSVTLNDRPEGSAGEHVATLYTDNQGLNWTEPHVLYPELLAQNIDTAYSANILSHAGRVYVLNNANLDNVTTLPDGSPLGRTDELGYFVFRYTDDGGASWSPNFYNISNRQTAIDRNNSFAGRTNIFWNVDQFKSRGNDTYAMFTKIKSYPQNPPEQGFVLHSPNALTELNASAVLWNLLPDADDGPTAPTPFDSAKVVAEEWHVVPLAQSPGFFAVFRTSTGYLGATKTADPTGRAGWEPSSLATYDAQPLPGYRANATTSLKNPRGPITLKRFQNGRYLLLWYFNSASGYTAGARSSRNPYWLSSGREVDGAVLFSQPEIVLYDTASTNARIGYPDFIEDVDGSIWITETDKVTARVHSLPAGFVNALFGQFEANRLITNGLVLNVTQNATARTHFAVPLSSHTETSFAAGGIGQSAGSGTTVVFWLPTKAPPGELFHASNGSATLHVQLLPNCTAVWQAEQENTTSTLATDPACSATLGTSGPHFLAFVCDTAAGLVYVMVDGHVCDGAHVEEWGWNWLASDQVIVGRGTSASVSDAVHQGLVYDRALLTTELVSLWRASAPYQI